MDPINNSDNQSIPEYSAVLTAETEDEFIEIYNFWYDVYIKEMCKHFASADHEHKILKDYMDGISIVHYIRDETGVIATIRSTPGDIPNPPAKLTDLYGLDMFSDFPRNVLSFSSRLVIDKRWRNTNLLDLLLSESYQFYREKGCQFNFAYCAPSLVQLYERLGMRRYKECIFDPDTGLRIPLIMVIEDIEHLAAVNSPFYKMARKLDNNPEPAVWFKKTFSEQISQVSPQAVPNINLWRFFQTKLHEVESPLFKGLNDNEIDTVIKTGTIITCRTGDHVISHGEIGNEMFLLLSGAVEVHYPEGGREYHLTNIGKGEIFGEMAFISETPRFANVIAMTDVELLIINQRFLKKITDISPGLANKLLFNLSLILCERLQATTLGLVKSIDINR